MCSLDLEETANRLGIEYFLVSYAPLNTDVRCSLIPKRAIREVQKNGCGMPPAMFFKSTPVEPEMIIKPDPKSLIQLPWKSKFAWLSSDLYMYGKPFDQCPRACLKRQVELAKSMGFSMKSGVEPEFTLLTKDGKEFADKIDMQQPMSLQDPLAIMRHSKFLTDLSDSMEKIGWNPYEIDHESSCCQYEINFDYVDCLETADRFMFMKFMIKELAEIHGIKASFMPVPIPRILCANGLHVNVSLWNNSTHTNAFEDDSDELGLSQIAYNFIGGLMKHVEDTCAICCPTVNSYKRLNRGVWCPNVISWGGNNRTVLFRIPASNRVEHRLPDATANPYLMQAAILASGLDGIINKIHPGPKADFDVQMQSEQFKKVPKNLEKALDKLESSTFLKDSLGEPIIDGFIHLKRKEWNLFHSEITPWEIDYYSNA